MNDLARTAPLAAVLVAASTFALLGCEDRGASRAHAAAKIAAPSAASPAPSLGDTIRPSARADSASAAGDPIGIAATSATSAALGLPSPSTVAVAPAIRSPHRVALRFLGALADAKLDAPRLAAASRELAGRASHAPDPLSRLPAHLAGLARKVTLPAAREKGQWEMREALFAPAPFSATWKVRVPEGARLVFDTARAPGLAYGVAVGGRVVARFEGRGEGRGPWTAREIDLAPHAKVGDEIELSLRTTGRGHGFFGAPRLLARTGDGPPSILLIAIDTLTAEAVGFCGGDRRLSPQMDALAGAGAAFPQAITNANWTRASTLSMFASEYSTALGINVHSWWLDRAARARLYRRHDGMLPELLKRAGYETAAIVNNLFILGYHSAGVEVGFERVTDFRTDHRDTPDVTSATLDFLARSKDRPFFLFVNLNTPHHPYTPPPRYLAGIERPGERLHPEHKRYLGEVKFADDYLGRVLHALQRHGLRERTLVVLTADHGEGLREDLAYTNVAIQRYSRFTHTVNMYDEVTRVPLSFTRPADIPKGRVLREQVRLLDVAPTILGLAGLRPHGQHRGVDLSSAILGRGEVPKELPAFVEGKKISSLRWKGYKYIARAQGYERLARRRDRGAVTKVPEELYAVATDPRELRDRTRAEPERLRELRTAHRAWQASLQEGVRPRERASASSPPAGAPSPSAAPSSWKATNSARNTGDPRGHTGRRTVLVVSSGAETKQLTGRLRVRGGRIASYRLRASGVDDGLWPSAPDTLELSLRADGGEDRVELVTEPFEAEIALELALDGRPLGAGAIGFGPFGLPLLDPPFVLRAADEALLLAATPPHRRSGTFAILAWREATVARVDGGPVVASPSAPSASEASAPAGDGGEALDADVEDALRGWGYIQAGDKVLK